MHSHFLHIPNHADCFFQFTSIQRAQQGCVHPLGYPEDVEPAHPAWTQFEMQVRGAIYQSQSRYQAWVSPKLIILSCSLIDTSPTSH